MILSSLSLDVGNCFNSSVFFFLWFLELNLLSCLCCCCDTAKNRNKKDPCSHVCPYSLYKSEAISLRQKMQRGQKSLWTDKRQLNQAMSENYGKLICVMLLPRMSVLSLRIMPSHECEIVHPWSTHDLCLHAEFKYRIIEAHYSSEPYEWKYKGSSV